MDVATESNETRFCLVLNNLESCERISSQLTHLDNLSSSINDENLPRLLDSTCKINNELQCGSLRGLDYQNLLRHNHSLESIIQIPSRLSECINVRSKFNDAIEMLEQISSLNSRYGTQVPIVNCVFRQSEELRSMLVLNLIHSLDRLSDCDGEASEIIGHLFRCGKFTERDLKLKYLQARDNWFNNRCEDSSASFDEVVIVHCEGLPLIFNEYKRIFCGRDMFTSREDGRLIDRDPMSEDGAIINSWLLMKTSIFVSSLEVYLKSIHHSCNQTPPMLRDTMQRCFELSSWLASIGFDFSSLLRPLFRRAIGLEVKASIEKATHRFETTFAATVSTSIESLLLPIEDEVKNISCSYLGDRLPGSIEHYPVFKIYCLHILNSLHWLHISQGLFSPISLTLDAYEALNTSLTRVTKALATILNLDSNSRHPILTKIAISYITEVLPFISKYCESILPEKVILSTIGLSKADFKKLESQYPDKLENTRLDRKKIAEPLRSTMPTLLQTVE